MSTTADISKDRLDLLVRQLRGGDSGRLATVLREQQIRQREQATEDDCASPIEAFHTGGSRRPFFLMHGYYVDAPPIWSVNLARALGEDQPVYLVEPLALEESTAPRLEAFAAAHVAWIRRIQPQGPYLLGGWCGGALVAFEMAQQLVNQGQVVDLLVLMEPPVVRLHIAVFHTVLRQLSAWVGLNPKIQLDWFIRLQEIFEYVGYQCAGWLLYRLRHQRRGMTRSFVEKAVRELRRGAASATTKVARRAADECSDSQENGPRPAGRPRADFLRIFAWLIIEYPVRAYSGKVTFFRASVGRNEGPAAHRLAHDIAAQSATSVVHVLPGDYESCHNEYVRDMARHLSECLNEVASGEPVQRAHVVI